MSSSSKNPSSKATPAAFPSPPHPSSPKRIATRDSKNSMAFIPATASRNTKAIQLPSTWKRYAAPQIFFRSRSRISMLGSRSHANSTAARSINFSPRKSPLALPSSAAGDHEFEHLSPPFRVLLPFRSLAHFFNHSSSRNHGLKKHRR